MNTLPIPTLIDSIITLLTEAYDGPPNPRETWFIDNEPDSGLLGILAGVTAEEASRSVDGSGKPGTTIAANAEHLRWSLANVNAAMRGAAYNSNWRESWELTGADEARWNRLRQALRQEFETLCQTLKQQPDLPGVYLNGTLALIPHAAYHLGNIRQMIERVR
jgi:hypothetical protein